MPPFGFSAAGNWQENMLDDLISYFQPREDVLGLLLFGSFSKPEFRHDYWSDLDILVVVKDGKIDDFFPTGTSDSTASTIERAPDLWLRNRRWDCHTQG